MIRSLPFKQIDVFTDVPFRGNPVAVVFDADDLTDEEMQRIANWTNLSETTFIRKSERADYFLRIFSIQCELPFAGHPTIGSAFAVREAGIVPQESTSFTQECKAGVIPIIPEDDVLMAKVPDPRFISVVKDADTLVSIFGGHKLCDETASVIDVGPVWMVTRLKNQKDLSDLCLNPDLLTKLSRQTGSVGINVYVISDDGEVHVRSFAPAVGVTEDPVCGSGNAAVAAHIRACNLHEKIGSAYTARQGSALGRDGYVQVRIENDAIMIGGRALTVIEGEIRV